MATIFPALAASASSVILPSATAASNDHMTCDDGDAAMVHMHNNSPALTSTKSRIMAADESTQGALDALASLAAASTAVSSVSEQHPQPQPQEITPHQTSSDEDDSEMMPPPPPRSPVRRSTIPSFSFLHDSTPFSNMHNATSPSSGIGGCGRLRSASNPEGMEKWDQYSRRNDRMHFVLPSSILEEELASTRRVLGEVADENGAYNTGGYNGSSNFDIGESATHGFNPQLQPDMTTETLSSGATGFKQHWVRRSSRRCAARLGTSPDSVSSDLSEEATPPPTISSKPNTPKSSTNQSKSNSSKKKSTRSKSPPQIVSSQSPPPEEEEEVDESSMEPEELLRRARSRLLEDLSEGSSSNGPGGNNGSGPNGYKGGSVLILPHSLSKYKEVYNKNGRIGIYTPAERAAIIQKFNAKRARRVWNKKIRYNCRKNLADRRMRVKGRFVKRSVEAAGTPTLPTAAEPEQTKNDETDEAAVQAKATLRSTSPPSTGSPLTTVTEDQEMPDVEDEEAGFQPTADMPYRRTRRYTIT